VEIAWSIINLGPTATEPPRLLYFALYTDRGKPFYLSHNGPKTPYPPARSTTEPPNHSNGHSTTKLHQRKDGEQLSVSLEKEI